MVEMLDRAALLKTRVDVVRFLIERDGDVCYLCNRPFYKEHEDHWSDYTIDHVIAKSRGGLDHVDNYKLAHFPCNQDKDDRHFLEDGTLEPKRSSGRKMQRSARPEICSECKNGRLIDRGFYCRVCGCEAGPPHWPWYAKRSAAECEHDEVTWCWMCGSGVIERSSQYITM
jgi:HNH endonuclease